MKPDSERRFGKRVAARVPTLVRTGRGLEHSAHTRDVSSKRRLSLHQIAHGKGNELELVLILPPELTSGEKCWVCCQATIVRVEELGNEFGVAAKIRRMDMLPEVAI